MATAAKVGGPRLGPVSMFKALILQAQHNLSDAKMAPIFNLQWTACKTE